MRVAAQIVQIAQLAKYRASSRIAQSFPQLIEGGDFVPIKELQAGSYLRSCTLNDTVSPIYCYFINEWLLRLYLNSHLFL